MKTLETKGFFFQFDIILSVFAKFFWFFWIPMLWLYGFYKYFHSYSAGTDFSRQNQTSADHG